MAKFRKKPVVIEAVQWTGGNFADLRSFADAADFRTLWHVPPENSIRIETLEGDMFASIGDWIIRGVAGELYPCKPDIFEQTYEPVGAR